MTDLATPSSSPQIIHSWILCDGVNGAEKLGHWGGVTVYHQPDDCLQ